MSTWEERMSAKAKARMAVAEAEEAAREAAWRAQLEADNPPAHPDESGPSEWRGHEGHYSHWTPAHGNTIKCSCGAIVGCFTVVIDEDTPPPPDHCEICELRGLTPLWNREELEAGVEAATQVSDVVFERDGGVLVGQIVEPTVTTTADTTALIIAIGEARSAARSAGPALRSPGSVPTRPALKAMHADYARRCEARRRRR